MLYTRNPNHLPLTNEEVRKLAPSVYATTPHERMSERYGHVTSSLAIDILGDYGFRPTQAMQVGRGIHKRHLVAFAHNELLREDSRPELIMVNSHDGTSALKLFAGVFRMICSNGMVAGEGFQNRMLHTNSTVKRFEEILTSTVERFPEMLKRIDTMKSTIMEAPDQIDFVYNALQLRWEMPKITKNTVEDTLSARRAGDHAMTQWGVFNRVQEAVIRGGIRVGDNDRKARAINSIDQNIRINKALWEMV